MNYRFLNLWYSWVSWQRGCIYCSKMHTIKKFFFMFQGYPDVDIWIIENVKQIHIEYFLFSSLKTQTPYKISLGVYRMSVYTLSFMKAFYFIQHWKLSKAFVVSENNVSIWFLCNITSTVHWMFVKKKECFFLFVVVVVVVVVFYLVPHNCKIESILLIWKNITIYYNLILVCFT